MRGDRVRQGPTFDLERGLHGRSIFPVAGVDEAGRGPLAGPVAVAAVILDPHDIPDGLDDSKALTAVARETLYEHILARAVAISLAFASPAEIDARNIRGATLAAMCRAVLGLSVRPAHALIDGRDVPPGIACDATAVVKGDALSQSIAAASIVAKVTRDRLMGRLALTYPMYGFDAHKGYATALHVERIEMHGPCPYHRMSFSPFGREETENYESVT